MNEDHLLHAPEFVIKPRSHTVWEKENVKLYCSVSGWPAPRVTWYVIFLKTSPKINYTKLILTLVKIFSIESIYKFV